MKSRRILIILNTFLMLASIGLVYFGIRAAKYQETEIQAAIRREAASAGKNTETVIAEIAGNINSELDLIGVMPANTNSLSACFVLNAGFDVIYPKLKKIRGSFRKYSFSDQFLKEFHAAERHEIKGDYKQAITAYENILNGSFSAAEMGFAQFALARALKKNGDVEDALSAYQQIIDDYPESFSPEGLNLRLIARNEIIRLEAKHGDRGSTFEESLRLARDIYEGKWDISRNEYEYFLNDLTESLDSMTPGMNVEQQNEWGGLRTFLQNDRRLREMIALVKSQVSGIKSDGIVIVPAGASQIYCKRIKNTKSGFIVAAVIKDSRAVNQQFAEMLKSKGISPEMMVQIINAEGVIIMATGNPGLLSPSVSLDLIGGMFGADQKIRIYNKRTGQIEAISKRHMLFNLILVGCLFVIVLACGVVSLVITLKEAELSRMKTNFISSVSHEMRLPLSTIKTANEMFTSDKVSDEKQAKKYHQYIASESIRLERLVDNVLDFSRIDAGRKKYNFKQDSISDAVKEAFDSMHACPDQDGFCLEERIEPGISGLIDKDSVSQAVVNLLDNARKYSGENKFIRVALFRDKNHAVVEIEDKGIGIAKNKTDKIFDRFYRVEDEMTRQTKGAGLGLALVRQTMQAHGGEARVRSIEREGSVFSLLFPLNS